ncbi:MAG: zinc ribbon domain-containing protein [Erysipelotrichia bacterium]|nr:zinc ribbon domain-containing protein [Erysipelotrichia bacterium]
MPVYEFLCGSCKKKFSILCHIDKRDEQHDCQYCNSHQTRRLVSRVKTVRTEDQLMESLADPAKLSGLDENDPRTFASWAKKMAREMGENMDDEIEAMAQEEFEGGSQDSAGDSPVLPPAEDQP